MIEQIIKGFTIEKIEALAIQEGWTRQIMTTTESPNYLIDNPKSALEYLDEKFNAPLRTAIKNFRLKEARELAENKIKEAQDELKTVEEADKEYIKNIISVKVENVV